MLQFVRTLASNKPFQIVLGLLLGVGFISFGATSFVPSLGPLVKIKGGNITNNQFQTYYQNQLAQANLSGLSLDQQKKLQLPEKILQQMILENILLQMAKDMNLQLSTSVLAQAIKQNPAFQDPTTGQFSKDRYLATIKQNGISEGVIISTVKKNLLLTWLRTYFEGARFDTPALATTWQGDNGQVAFNYLTVDATSLSPTNSKATTPSDDDLKKFYNSNLELYQKPTYRRFQILSVPAQAIAASASKKIVVSEQEVKAAYDAARDEFTVAPQYQFEQLLFADKKLAEDFNNKKNAGQSLAAQKPSTAKFSTISLNGNDLTGYGFQANDAAGKTSAVVETPFGFAIVRLTKKIGGGTKPMAEVAATLRAQLKAQKTNQAIDDTYRLLGDQLASGKGFAAALQAAGVVGGTIATTGFIDNQGRDQQGVAVKNQPYIDNIKSDGFGDSIKKNPLVLTNNQDNANSLVSIAVLGDQPTFLPPFEKIKTTVAADWKKNEDKKLLMAEKQKLDDQIAKGQFDFAAYQQTKKIPVATFRFSQKQMLGEQTIFQSMGNSLDNNDTLRVLFAPAATGVSTRGAQPKLFVMKLVPRAASATAANNADFKKQFQAAVAEGALLNLYRTHNVTIDWARLDGLFKQ